MKPADGSGPYWRRAHHHFPFWVGVILMFAAIGIYVMTNSLSLLPGGTAVEVPTNDLG